MRLHDLDNCHGDECEKPFDDKFDRIEWQQEEDEFINQMKGAIYGKQIKSDKTE